MWAMLSEAYWGVWLFYFVFLERALANAVFPVFPTAAARHAGIAVQPPEPGAAAGGGRQRAGPGAVPGRRGAAAPAAARLHPHGSARSARSAARPALLGPRAPRGTARAPAAGIRAAARATGTAAPQPPPAGGSSPCSSALFIQSRAPWGTAAMFVFWGWVFLGMCFVMNDLSLLEEQQSLRFSCLLAAGKTPVLHSFLVSQMLLGGNWTLLLPQGKSRNWLLKREFM